MALIELAGGRIFDPRNGVDGEVRDLHLRDGRLVTLAADERIEARYDLRGMVVMAGGIDLHTHIGGGKVNLARMLLPEDHQAHSYARGARTRAGSGHATPSSFTAGYRYAQMGYTSCFEPAMLPVNARQAHLEMGDTPIVDHGAYALLGNDDFLLRLLARKAEQQTIDDYVAWTLQASQALAIKVVNPGGISAFKFNQRRLDLDQTHIHYGVTPRVVLQALARAVHNLGIAHPLHVHASNLGVPGNLQTTLDTMRAAEGLPLHLTHVQFHSYGTEGDRKFSSGAAQIAEAVNGLSNISIDVGQIAFGQTVTCSADSMSQYRNSALAQPNKWIVMDIECDAGCGVVPFRYRDKSFVNALQWAIGLELFLLVRDPWRVVLTTDHPNGAPFTSYPQLIHLLMDRGFRNERLLQIHPDAAAMSALSTLSREYSLYEIAIVTRAAPARLLGLADRGHLGPGAAADIAVYRDQSDREAMFERPVYVFKDGVLVVRDGEILATPAGGVHRVQPQFDAGIERELEQYFRSHQTMRISSFKLGDAELIDCNNGCERLYTHPSSRRT